VKINSSVAIILVTILVFISYNTENPIPDGKIWTSVLFAALSILPAPITLTALWMDASRFVKQMKRRADSLESRALQAHR
jgi:hypothetical protein